MDNRQERLNIFEGTRQLCQNSDKLKSSIEISRKGQKIYWENEEIHFDKPRFSSPAEIVLSQKKTVQAARQYAEAGKRVCILNFASSVSPGGGVVTGAQAQEESICRVSTLYFALSDSNTAGIFYERHWEMIKSNKMNRRNTDDVIYTPDIMVVRDDGNGEKELPENEWYQLDVITCAAPDLRVTGDKTEYSPSEDELFAELRKRWRCILAAGAKNEADVLILGAFGCGVFANPPHLVAQSFCDALKSFENYFETIEFAIFSGKADNINYRSFEEVLK